MFRIASFKRTTARAVILRNVPHCYTVEASNAFYYSSVEKKDINFTCPVFAEMVNIGVRCREVSLPIVSGSMLICCWRRRHSRQRKDGDSKNSNSSKSVKAKNPTPTNKSSS